MSMASQPLRKSPRSYLRFGPPRYHVNPLPGAHTNLCYKLFRREVDDKTTSILSLDFDDPGELLMTSESDESIQIYNVKDGKHQKSCLSKKYGVKLAKFTHTSSCIIYASTKENGMLLPVLLLITKHCLLCLRCHSISLDSR